MYLFTHASDLYKVSLLPVCDAPFTVLLKLDVGGQNACIVITLLFMSSFAGCYYVKVGDNFPSGVFEEL